MDFDGSDFDYDDNDDGGSGDENERDNIWLKYLRITFGW